LTFLQLNYIKVSYYNIISQDEKKNIIKREKKRNKKNKKKSFKNAKLIKKKQKE
jgi:hypothetical protein